LKLTEPLPATLFGSDLITLEPLLSISYYNFILRESPGLLIG